MCSLVNLEPNWRSTFGNVPLDHVCVHVQSSQRDCPRDQCRPKETVGPDPTIRGTADEVTGSDLVISSDMTVELQSLSTQMGYKSSEFS